MLTRIYYPSHYYQIYSLEGYRISFVWENVKERFVIVRLIFLYSFPSYLTFYEITSCFFKETSRIWKVFLKFDSIWDLAYD